MWNAHNTVFSSKHSANCAQAVYFLHLMRPSVTWLNSRWWLATCDWVMSALSDVFSTRIRRRIKFGEVFFCAECIGQGNDFELILTVQMETRYPVEGHFGSELPAICNHCGVITAWSRKSLKILKKFLRFFWKNDPCDKIAKILFRKFSSQHRSTCCVPISWNLADKKSVKSIVPYPTKKFRLAL